MSTQIALLGGEPFTQDELQVFDKKHLAAFQYLQQITKQKKALEDEEKKLKAELEKVMGEYNIKSLENEFIKITMVEATSGKLTIDLEKLKKEEPDLHAELLADYPKMSGGKSGYIRFNVK